MKHPPLLTFFLLLFFIIQCNMASCFQLNTTPFFLNNQKFTSRVHKCGNKRAIPRLEKSLSLNGKSLKRSSVDKSDVYENIKNFVLNNPFSNRNENNNNNRSLDKLFPNFASSPDVWDEVPINDMNNKDVTHLINFLYAEYKRAFVLIDEKRKNAENTFNSEKIKSLFLSLGSITVDSMNIDEFFKYIESYSILLKYCKDNYVSFSFIKNEIGNIMNAIIKHSQNYLHDKHLCDKMKNEFVLTYELIKDIKKNDAINVNVKNFFSVLNTNALLNNNYIFCFLTEIFSTFNLLVRDSPDLIHYYEHILNSHFFFITIFSLYSYNISKARFYYLMLLIHNQINLENFKERGAKYDDNLNYNEYKSYIFDTIFEKEKREYEFIKGIIINNKKGSNDDMEKGNKACNENLSKNQSNEKEVKDITLNNKESLVKGCKRAQFKELYENTYIKILLFYIFFFFSDYYFCIIILLNFTNSIKDMKKDNRLTQITNYLFFLLLDSLYPVRDYFNIILLLSLYKRNFNSLQDKDLGDMKKNFNSVTNDNTQKEISGGMSKLLLEISESIKNVENERGSVDKNSTNNFNENKNSCQYVHTNNLILEKGNKEEAIECNFEGITEENGKSGVHNEESKDDVTSKDSNSMTDMFNKYLLRLLKNKAYDKIERLEKRDNLYVNNKTYSLFIKSFLSNHKYDRVYKVYKKMKAKKSIPIKYLNVKNLIHSFKNCDVDKGDVLNELNLINKSYLNLYFSKDAYFVLTKTLMYKHMCDFLKKKCDMKLFIDIFNFNELLKYFIKFKSFINIKKLYFLLLKYSYIKTYKTYLILIRFFNNINYESDNRIDQKEGKAVEGMAECSWIERLKEDENEANDAKDPFQKNVKLYKDIINLRKNQLSYYIFHGKDWEENFNLFNTIYNIAKKDKYEISLFILSNFITEYIFMDYGSDDILESELTNINNILNIFFEAINLFFYKENYRITVNIYFFLLLFLNYYVTRYAKKDLRYSTFLKKNTLNFFLSNNYEVIKINKDIIYSYIPNFILHITSMSVNHLKNAHNLKEIVSMELPYDLNDFNINVITTPEVNCKKIISIFLLLKNNLILCNVSMEKDLYDKQKSNDKKGMQSVSVPTKRRNYFYKDVIEKHYNDENQNTEENFTSDSTSKNIANIFVKLKYTIGSDKINEDSLKEFLFKKLKMYVNNKNIDSLINTLRDIFFTYSNIIYLNSRDFLYIYENLSWIYDSTLSAISIVFFIENKKNVKGPNAGSTTTTATTSTTTSALKGEQTPGGDKNEINIHEYINMLRSMDKTYFKDILNIPAVRKLLKKYETFIHMCLYFDLNKKKVDNVIALLEMSRKCDILVSTETLIDVFSLYFEKRLNNLIFKEFEVFSLSEETTNFKLYYTVMKAAFFEVNTRVALKVFNTVLNSLDIKRIPLNFFECILLILKKKGKHKDLYQSIDRLHRELIKFEKNKEFSNLEKLTEDIKSILQKCKAEKHF